MVRRPETSPSHPAQAVRVPPSSQGYVPHEHHHRDVQGGAARAAVFGVSDGLVTNVSLILGMAGANPTAGVVRLAGLVGLVAGAFSMATGEYISMKAQSELLARELEMERIEIHRRPENERRELAAIYRSRGVDAQVAEDLATEMHRDPDLALETHAREELGINPHSLGSPTQAAVSSFVAFSAGALVSLVPWFFVAGGHHAGAPTVVASLVLAAVTAVIVGVGLARFTGRSAIRSAARQLFVSGLAAGATFMAGRFAGSHLTL
ncbi:MAG: vacuolar iron transporter family protein [Actinomycetota bacterium]|jgi:VIT1/CCC1 family predicted Fe2+/Mn2+ transporter|nr:vacuolar iron transporter family protein [Actinomycetota bacterium]